MPPSEEVTEEIEVLNSIYGDGTLLPSPQDPGIYILILPSTSPETDLEDPSSRPSVRISFPSTYPSSSAPSVLATHSAGTSAKPGAAVLTLSLFQHAIESNFTPGTVCLFDAIEDFRTRLEEAEASARPPTPPPAEERSPSPVSGDDVASQPPPPWVLSDPYTEMKSTFLARAALVKSPAQASGYVSHLLATDKRARAASHNITAWRIRGASGASYQDCDDDGETAAGGRMLKLLQLMDVWDVMVVVTRWYGGQKLGPRRFAVINTVAREAVVRLVGEGAAGGKKKGGR
ncbi:ribosomal protein S5 domain 2-type protein [Plectosphaerella plurivora]|uniref:Ribosomal protein S5 domain 2-type protein n=1 Tax=Plectosphaerella plurivora TaxID=936078 RepID=A0A9P9AEA0_9PEZI|nr:ribosomal protein S5 domain 2-type protein [Plectosphaerella plurivora]